MDDAQCYDEYIDASMSTSLTLNCNGDESCKAAKIQCPVGENTWCDINCVESKACSEAIIDAGSTNFSLHCSNADGACEYLNVTDGPSDNAYIECSSSSLSDSKVFVNRQILV